MSGFLATDDTTPRGRLNRVLDVIFRGNQGPMACATGVSQASLSRVIRGVQEPGRRLMCSVAALPGVDAVWLFTGRGEPFPAPVRAFSGEADKPRSHASSCPDRRPSTSTSSPGCPCRSTTRASPRRPTGSYRGGRPDTLATEQKVAAGDMLLIEADPATWRYDPEAAIDCLVALQVGKRADREVYISLRQQGAAKGEWAFDDFGAGPSGCPVEKCRRARWRGTGRI